MDSISREYTSFFTTTERETIIIKCLLPFFNKKAIPQLQLGKWKWTGNKLAFEFTSNVGFSCYVHPIQELTMGERGGRALTEISIQTNPIHPYICIYDYNTTWKL